MNWRYSWLATVLLVAGCAQLPQWNQSNAAALPAADFAFVYDNQLQLVSPAGVVTPTAIVAANTLPAVSQDGTAVLYAETIDDKYQLSLLHTDTGVSETIVGTTALPSQLLFSEDADIALIIMDEQLFLMFVPQRRLVRVHEGVIQAGFSSSNQRIEYQTADNRLLSREFVLDGSLADAKALPSNPFLDLVIETRDNTIMAGWSKQGSGVYYVDTQGNVTLVEYEVDSEVTE